MLLDESLFMNEVQNTTQVVQEVCLIESVIDDTLLEAMSSTLPQWLVRAIETNSALRTKLVNRGFDLANLQFVRIPENEIPKNGFHPVLKDDTK